MEKAKPFVVPAGVVFQIEDDGVTIENAGDVVLHTDFGGRLLKRIVSHEGSVVLHGAVRARDLQAAGDVEAHGDAEAESVSAGGSLSVHGHGSVGRATVGGNVTAGGNLRSTQLKAGGSVQVSGALNAESVGAGGDLQVGGDLTAGRVELGGGAYASGNSQLGPFQAGGSVVFVGNVVGTTLHAAALDFRGAAVQARGIQGTAQVTIQGAKLTVDAILAPEVVLDPRTSGRVTVIESANERGSSAIKGGFGLADYAEMFGNADGFLAERGLTPLGAAGAAPAAPAEPPASTASSAPAPAETATPVEVQAPAPDEPVAPAAEEPAAPAAEEAAAPEAEAQAAAATEESPSPVAPAEESAPATEASADPVSVEATPVERADDPATSSEEGAAVVSPTPDDAPAAHPLHSQLAETVQRIVDAYPGELPPAVEKLQELVTGHKYDLIRSEISNVWSEHVKYHQKRGVRITNPVTAAFNHVNSLVKKM